MREGLLWFDDDPGRALAEKVEQAAQRYWQRRGRRPTICYVHPSLLNGGPQEVGHVRVMPLASVLLHHFWLGVEEA